MVSRRFDLSRHRPGLQRVHADPAGARHRDHRQRRRRVPPAPGQVDPQPDDRRSAPDRAAAHACDRRQAGASRDDSARARRRAEGGHERRGVQRGRVCVGRQDGHLAGVLAQARREILRAQARRASARPRVVPRVCACRQAEDRAFGAGRERRLRRAGSGARRTPGHGLLVARRAQDGTGAGRSGCERSRRKRLSAAMGHVIAQIWEVLTRRVDSFLFGCALAIVGVGLITLFSAADQSVSRVTTQPMSFGLALVLMWFVANVPPQTLARAAVPLYVLGVLLLVGVALFGTVVNGSRRWLNLGVARIQPSELMKVALPLMWSLLHDYQRERILTFIDPSRDPLGAGYHSTQASIALGSGGIVGKGWLNGTQTHLDFLPEKHTDFIFAVFGEEFGLIGSAVLLLLYMLLVGRAMVITANASTLFG